MTKQSKILLAKQNEATARLVKALGYIDLAKNVLNKGTFKSNLEITKKLDELAAQIRDDIRVHEGNAALLTQLGKKSAQYRRDEIVAQAKAAVAELKSQSGHNFDGIYYADAPNAPHVLEFVVNHEKRTVVALIKGKRSGRVYRKGIAKCAPDDCFNAHIGKAIALNRALGFPVPVKYLNAPQPTEVRVGDIIRTTSDINVVRIIDDSREWRN